MAGTVVVAARPVSTEIGAEVDLETLSLEDLGVLANREIEGAESAMAEALHHAIRCGIVLLHARDRVHADGGLWHEWLSRNFDRSKATVSHLMRVARYRHDLLEAVDAGDLAPRTKEGVSVAAAVGYLRGRPQSGRIGRRSPFPDEVRASVREMRAEGASYAEISAETGVARSTIRLWVDDAAKQKALDRYKAQRAEAKAAKALMKRDLHAKAVRQLGGSVAEGYSLIRKAAQEIDRAMSDAIDPDARAGLSIALGKLHAAEDEVLNALGIS